MVIMLVLMCLEDFACLEIGCVESLTLFISELSFWRCELLKNDGRLVPEIRLMLSFRIILSLYSVTYFNVMMFFIDDPEGLGVVHK
jgi:hypothetical protein